MYKDIFVPRRPFRNEFCICYSSKLEILIRWDLEDLSQNLIAKEKNVLKIDCSLIHILDFNDSHPKQLHKWEFSSKYSTFKDSKASKAMVSLNRKTESGDKWKVSLGNDQTFLGGEECFYGFLKLHSRVDLRNTESFGVGQLEHSLSKIFDCEPIGDSGKLIGIFLQ